MVISFNELDLAMNLGETFWNLKITFQFGNIVSNTPIKRRKVISQEMVTEAVPLNYQNSCESVILNCRSIRIGMLRRMVVEPVIVSTLALAQLAFHVFMDIEFLYLNNFIFCLCLGSSKFNFRGCDFQRTSDYYYALTHAV